MGTHYSLEAIGRLDAEGSKTPRDRRMGGGSRGFCGSEGSANELLDVSVKRGHTVHFSESVSSGFTGNKESGLRWSVRL